MVYIMVCHVTSHRKKWLEGEGKPTLDYTSRAVVPFLHIIGLPLAMVYVESTAAGICCVILLIFVVSGVYLSGIFDAIALCHSIDNQVDKVAEIEALQQGQSKVAPADTRAGDTDAAARRSDGTD